jgi:hypothetical protein
MLGEASMYVVIYFLPFGENKFVSKVLLRTPEIDP